MTDLELMDLYRKVSVFGLGDLRKLAPIGDIGYLNGIEFYKHWHKDERSFVKFCRTTLLEWVMDAFDEQRKRMGYAVEGHSTGYRGTDHHAYCPELGLRWSVDSGD